MRSYKDHLATGEILSSLKAHFRECLGEGRLRTVMLGDEQYTSHFAYLVESIWRCLSRKAEGYTGMIHNSFSAKHLLFEQVRPDPACSRLAVLDGDSAVRGPREKDISSFLASLPGDREDSLCFLHEYEEETGFGVDRELANGFLQYRRLLKLCRRILRGKETGDSSSDVVWEIEQGIRQNPLRENYAP